MTNVGFTLSSVENGYLVRVEGDPTQGPGYMQSIHIAQTLEEAKQIVGEVFVTKQLEGEKKKFR